MMRMWSAAVHGIQGRNSKTFQQSMIWFIERERWLLLSCSKKDLNLSSSVMFLVPSDATLTQGKTDGRPDYQFLVLKKAMEGTHSLQLDANKECSHCHFAK